ncbi:negative elongation factor E [Coccinella septempunctata]|uniref:negative elongation factor E n=1 Tax=Coccinella septempunctata TaxID=41139 RepID=UPI001D0748FD|nr:negative elongation factor E [Coccinella septempunctata]
MVYLHFPANFTEEELMLQTKYQKLKKKKKALQAFKIPKPEPEKPLIPKRPAEVRDAREVAKKLLKSGAIQAIQKQPKQPEQGFKRPRGLERKLLNDKVSGYQPFSAVQMEDGPENPENKPPRIKNLYESFANARDREERGFTDKLREKTEKPRQGNTIYVTGYKITEEFLKKHFSTFGNIVNISMEIEKNRGFITFDRVESASRAIAEMDGSIVSEIQLNVSLARRQPQIGPTTDAPSSAAWATLASSHSQKGNHRENREMINYDEMDLFD